MIFHIRMLIHKKSTFCLTTGFLSCNEMICGYESYCFQFFYYRTMISISVSLVPNGITIKIAYYYCIFSVFVNIYPLIYIIFLNIGSAGPYT